MSKAAFGIFSRRATVDNAIEVLKGAGFRKTDISVLVPQNDGAKEFTVERASRAPEGAVTGAILGAAIGGTLGWLAGSGVVALPVLTHLAMAGAVEAALAGLGMGGALGGLAGAIIGLGVPEYVVRRYEGRTLKGGILLSVHCDDSGWTDKAKKVLERTGAEDVASTPEAPAE